MYEVIVRTYCLGRGYETYNEINVPFDVCYGDKMDAVKVYNDQFETYCRESEGDLYYKENGSFKIENKNPVFISSYDLPSDKFRRVASVEKGSSLYGGMNYCDDKIEGLYVPKEQVCDLVDYVQVKLF